LSNNTYRIKHTIKYTAAYFDKKAKPSIIPSKIKFILFGRFVILYNSFSDRVQNKTKKISVLKKNDEKETTGINRNNKIQLRASFFFNPIFLVRLYNAKATKKYIKDGINLSTRKLLPNILVKIAINHAINGGLE
tara:strand:+ start:781 stop:1185 length:405 start_codon:yes stop_codon:yes gene_type:complete